ncbi:MAG: methyltransferase domain-containing protein [Casimicrobiaceae bacterium]
MKPASGQSPEADVVKQEVVRGPGGRVIIVDSITQLAPDDAGAIVVCGSHGGTSAGTFALEVPLAAVFFNDAGAGKDGAGIAALTMLQARGVPAGTVAHTSARIGDAQDAWDNGVLSHVNAAARALGLAPEDRLSVVLAKRVMRSGNPVAPEGPVADAATPTASGPPTRQDPYYLPDLAWVHHVGYAHHVERVHSAIVDLLRNAGIAGGARVLDVGCGSGLLARELVTAGFEVHGIDASPAMIDLARKYAPTATFEVLPLPARAAADVTRRTAISGAAGLPVADAIVSTGHVLNYLDSREEIAAALAQLARALRPGGVIAVDLMTEAYCRARDTVPVHAKVEADWAILTRFSRPAPFRYDRDITVFRRIDGQWRRSDERHRNITFEADEAVRILRDNGIEADVRPSFGSKSLPAGLVVVVGTKWVEHA